MVITAAQPYSIKSEFMFCEGSAEKNIKPMWKLNNVFLQIKHKIYMKLVKKTITNYLRKTYLKHTKGLLVRSTVTLTKRQKMKYNYEILKRVNCLLTTDVFITLKEDKPNFTTNSKCRLINPSKSELGKVINFLNAKMNH